VVYFWGFCKAHWVQVLYAVCWNKLSWAFIPSMFLGMLMWWPSFSLYFVYFGLGRECWGVLVYVCDGQSDANEGFHVFSVLVIHLALFTPKICCMVLLLPWISSSFPCPLLCGLVPSSWVVNFHLVTFLPPTILILHYLLFFAAPTPLTFI